MTYQRKSKLNLPTEKKVWHGQANICSEDMLEAAMASFRANYNHVIKEVQWAMNSGFSYESAFAQVRRNRILIFLKYEYNLSEQFSLHGEFVQKMIQLWTDQYDINSILNEFDDLGWNDNDSYVENHFLNFVAEYLWKQYSIVLDYEL